MSDVDWLTAYKMQRDEARETNKTLSAELARWRQAWDALRQDVLHNADGILSSDEVNTVLGCIDDHDPRPTSKGCQHQP